MARASSNEMALRKDIEVTLDPKMYFPDRWPNIVPPATTDTDGRFRKKLPAGRALFLAAHVSREVGSQTERFCWMLPISQATWPETFLNNDNMLSPQPVVTSSFAR